TWYHTSTATSGLERSTCRITGKPFSRTNVSNGIVSIGGTKEPASLHESPSSRGLKYARFSLGVAVALVALLAPAGRAHANGALAGSSGILVPVDHPQQIMLETNFGLIISQDGGAGWLWSCERPQVSYGYLYS